MKKFILIFLSSLPLVVFSQEFQLETDTAKNCLTLRNGKVVLMQNGKATVLKQDSVLLNGTKITTNGNIIRKDGTKTLMVTGQCFSMEGTRMSNEPGKTRKVAAIK